MPAESGARRRFGTAHFPGSTRLVLWSGILVASFGFVLVAASQSRPDLVAARFGFTALTGGKTEAHKTKAELANLASFQRRGNSLVGEVTTREGVIMRLVFDARTHTLIGLRVLDPADTRPGEPEGARGCIDQSIATPLPPSPATAATPPLPKSGSPAN